MSLSMAVAAAQPNESAESDEPHRRSRLKGWQALSALLVIGVSLPSAWPFSLRWTAMMVHRLQPTHFFRRNHYDAARCEDNLRRIAN